MAMRGGETVSAVAPAVQVRDSTGAGDTFNAGYLDAWLRGAALEEALETGCRLASTVIGQPSRSAIAPGDLSGLAYRAPSRDV